MRKPLVALFICFLTRGAFAADSLLYLETQGIIGYSSEYEDARKIIFRSGTALDVMQLNSIGFDYIKKFSGEGGDTGTFGLQARIAYNHETQLPETQIYNAYLKGKTPIADIWVGHNRIAFGLASYWDTHGTLLQALPMYGFGFDRDWGAGITRDFAKGGVQAALSAGTGMGIQFDGNWLATVRANYGVLSYDNFNAGLSFMGGKKPDVMGYMIMGEPKYIFLGGVDFSYNHNNIEHKAELVAGSEAKEARYAGLYRIGVNLFDDSRLKLEGQYVYTKITAENFGDHALGAGLSYKLNGDLTARTMYEWQYEKDVHRVIVQIYFYSQP